MPPKAAGTKRTQNTDQDGNVAKKLRSAADDVERVEAENARLTRELKGIGRHVTKLNRENTALLDSSKVEILKNAKLSDELNEMETENTKLSSDLKRVNAENASLSKDFTSAVRYLGKVKDSSEYDVEQYHTTDKEDAKAAYDQNVETAKKRYHQDVETAKERYQEDLVAANARNDQRKQIILRLTIIRSFLLNGVKSEEAKSG